MKSLIVGLGKTGLSCLRYLSQCAKQVVAVDTRETYPDQEKLVAQYNDVDFYFGPLSDAMFSEVTQIVLSPGVSQNHPSIQRAVEKGATLIGDIDLFARANKAPVLAVTGSNGKSTVVTLLGEMAKIVGVHACVAGNIGLPVLDTLSESYDLVILELSSFQLETMHDLAPLASVVLNVTEDHMDRYENFQAYFDAKMRIYPRAKTKVFSQEDKKIKEYIGDDSSAVCYSATHKLSRGFSILEKEGKAWFSEDGSPFLCVEDAYSSLQHEKENILAALTLGSLAGFSNQSMSKAIQQFKPLPHRCEVVGTMGGVLWINDSKATNPKASQAAIESLSQQAKRLWLIAGGNGKSANFEEWARSVNHYVHHTFLIGKDQKILADMLSSSDCYVTLQQAVLAAKAQAESGDVVLLSPACASTDMFANFEERGEVFKAVIREVALAVP